nr:MAG TPA: hypothetical protein [Caudoviricetes sp.]
MSSIITKIRQCFFNFIMISHSWEISLDSNFLLNRLSFINRGSSFIN